MFEGVVSQVLAGLLGRYVKGIQKEQLKIGIWNGRSSIPFPPSLPPLRPITQTGGCLSPAALQFVPVLLPQHLFWNYVTASGVSLVRPFISHRTSTV